MSPVYEELFDSSIALEQNKWTQDALLEIPTSKGVLLFVNSENRPVQLLQTANLRRLSRTRIIQDETPSPRKIDIASLTHTIYWRSCYNDFMTQIDYIRLSRALFTETTDNWIQFPTPSLAAIDRDAPLPFFYVSSDPACSKERVVMGLFPNRKAASKFAEVLNTVFTLCRNPSLLKTQRLSGCPYLQMKTCPGPCLESSLRGPYHDRVNEAVTAEKGHFQSTLGHLRAKMDSSANTLDFERAKEAKKRIDQITSLQGPDFRWVHPLEDLSILHVDRSFKKPVGEKKRKVLHYKWLKIVSNAVYDLGDFHPKTQADVERFLEKNWTTASPIPYTPDRKEHLGNMAYFLFRSKPSGLWLDCTDGILPEPLFSGLTDRFELCC